MKKLAIIVTLLFAAVYGFSQPRTDANVFGHVIDIATGEHLPFAFVSIDGQNIGVMADSTGHYFLTNLPAGLHGVTVSFIGYENYHGHIQVNRNSTAEYNFALTPTGQAIEEVVVTGNRYATRKRETGQIVNVVSPKLFKKALAVNPAGVLDFQPGSRIEYNCANCGLPSLRINGLGGQYSQILLDGRPIFSPLSMVYGLEQLPSAMIERIETVRGGGSALYGSNAIAGIVNIITREPVRSMAHLSNQSGVVQGGGFDIATALNASAISEDRMSGAYVFSMARNRDAYDHDSDGFSEMPRLKSQTIGMRAYHKFSQNARLTAEYHNIHEFRRGGDNLDQAPYKARLCEQLEHYINGGGLSFDREAGDHDSYNVYVSGQHVKRDSYFGTDYNLDAYGKTTDITINAGAQYIHRFANLVFMPSVLTAGVDYAFNKLDDEMLGYNRVIHQKTGAGGLFFQNEWSDTRLGFLLGLRADKHSLLESVVFSPRATLRYAPSPTLTFRTSFAQGYRAPQTYDEDLHVGAVGGEVSLIRIAPGLRPEFSNSVTASANWFKKTFGWQFDVLVEGFYTRLKDVFVLVPAGNDDAGNQLLDRTNANGAYVAGLNAELRVNRFESFSFEAGATLQRSRYTEDFSWSEGIAPQLRMFRTPDFYAYLDFDWDIAYGLALDVNSTFTGPMLVEHYAGYISKDREEITPWFTDLSARLSYTFDLRGTRCELSASCKNLLNRFQSDADKGVLRDSKYIYGPMMPRTFYIGLSIDI